MLTKIHFKSKLQPLYNTIVGVQDNFRVSYPIRVMSVKYRYIAKLYHLGSMNGPCYIQNRAVTKRVIKRSRCMFFFFKKKDSK